MGRTGKVWGYENFDVEPDVITSAKVRRRAMPYLLSLFPLFRRGVVEVFVEK